MSSSEMSPDHSSPNTNAPSSRSSRVTWAITVVVVLLVIGGVSAAVYQMKSEGGQRPADLNLENHLPNNSALVVTVDTQEANARKYFPDLLRKFSAAAPEEQWQSSVQTALQGEPEAAAATEIATVLRSVRKAALSVTDETPAAVYLVATMSDSAAFAGLSQKLESVSGYKADTYQSAKTIGNTEKNIFIGQAGEMLYVANTETNLHKLVDDAFAETSLAKNEHYRSVADRTGANFITAYFQPEVLGLATKRAMKQEGMTEEQQKQLEQSTGTLRAISAMAFGIGVEQQGLNVTGLTLGNKSVLDQMQLTFNMLPQHDPYLIGSVPAGNTIFAAESYNVRQALANSMKLNSMDQTQLDEVTKQLRTSLQTLGLDLDDDVYSLFEQGTVLALQTDTGNLFPRITLVTDAKGKEESTRKVLAALDKGLSDIIAQLTRPGSGIPSGLITKGAAKVKTEDFTKLSVNTAAIGALLGEETSPTLKAAVDGLKVEVWLGLTDESHLIITTSSEFDKRVEKDSITDEKEYQDAFFRIKDTKSGIAYLNVANLVSYIDQVYQVATEAQATTGNEDYKKFIDSLRPIRYLVFGSSPKEYETESNGFLKIGE